MRVKKFKSKSRAWVVGICVAFLSLVTVIDNVWAQACCASSGSSDFSVVGRQDIAVVAAMLQYEPMLGYFNRNGEYVSVERSVVRDVVFTAGIGVRPLPAFKLWQVGLVVPFRYQYRWYDRIPPSSKFGLGDASLSTRFTVIEDRLTGFQRKDAMSFLPFLDLFVGVKSPTGRSPEESVEPSGSDAMGDGSWAVNAGLTLQKFITRKGAVTLGFDYAMKLPHEVSGSGLEGASAKFDPGDVTTYRASLQYIPDFEWSASMFANLMVTYPSKFDGDVVKYSQILRWRMGMSLTWVFAYPNWEVTVAAMTDPWWNGGGWNVTFAGPSAMLQFRYNFTHREKLRETSSAHESSEEIDAPVAFDDPPPVGTRATCPVMKEQFVVTARSERSEYKGRHYAFCCPGCKEKFDTSPEQYLK